MDRKAQLQRDIQSIERLCEKLTKQGNYAKLAQMEGLLSDFQQELDDLTHQDA